MGLFDQDDVPIINSILGNAGGWNQGGGAAPGDFGNAGAGSTPQNINPAVALGLNKYASGDPYGALNVYANGAQPIPTDISGATPQLIPPATGMPPAVPVATGMPDATRAVAPVSAPQASGQVPMPTAAFQPTPQASPAPRIGMQPGSPAPAMPAPINVSAAPGAGYPTQPPMPRPVGAPMALGAPAGGIDVSAKANWLGRALGATSPAQGQNIAQQFLSGLGAGMGAAAHYANKPGGAAFAGSFGAAMEGAQKRGDIQAQRAFEWMKFQAAQQQQDRMNKLLERKQNYVEQSGDINQFLKTHQAMDSHLLSTARASRYNAAAEWDHRKAVQDNSNAAWQLTPSGKEHQLQQDIIRQFSPLEVANERAYAGGTKAKDEYEAYKADLDARRKAYQDEQRSIRGIDPSKITKGTQENPHEPSGWVQTRTWNPGTVYKAPEDYKDANGDAHKKGSLVTRGQDEYNTPLGPRPQAPQEYPQPQTPVSEEPAAAGPSDQEIAAAAGG